MVAMHLGLNFDLKDKVPVDVDRVFQLLTVKAEDEEEGRINEGTFHRWG